MTPLVTVTIRDYLGIHGAQFDIPAGVTLVAGDNFAGKSSVLHAIAALATGEPTLSGSLKRDAHRLVHDGARVGALVMFSPDGEAEIMLPSATFVSRGKTLHASPIAAGIHWLGELDKSERAKVLVELLEATPDRAELMKAMEAADIRTEHRGNIADLVEQQGWDSAAVSLKDNRTKLKGQWEKLTNERWGKDKSVAWRPKGWRTELEDREDEELSAAIENAKAAVEEAAARKAVGAEERRRLQDLDIAKPQIEEELRGVLAQLDEFNARIEEIKNEIAGIGTVRDGKPVPCPHCQQPLDIEPFAADWGGTGYRIIKAELLTDEELRKRRDRWKSLMDERTRADQKLREVNGKANELRAKLTEANEASTKLAKMEAPKGAAEKQGNEHAQALMAYDKAVLDKRMYDQLLESVILCDRIDRNTRVIDLLEPDGMRKAKLEQKLALFQKQNLDPLIAEALTWRETTIDPDTLMPYYGKRPYLILSASEKFRCRVALQIAFAMLDGSDVIIIDGADILNDEGREDLFTLLAGLPCPVIVGMMLNRKSDVPILDSPALDMGVSLWVEKGELTKLGAPQ